ncbi:DNA-processing protein DprA [Candidatus Latescibacterota bacterium]
MQLNITYHFTIKGALRRNRLLTAFSTAVIVVEPGDTGGTWSSVQTARELGKPIFFIEGRRKDFINALQRNGGKRIPIKRGTPDLTDILAFIDAQDQE